MGPDEFQSIATGDLRALLDFARHFAAARGEQVLDVPTLVEAAVALAASGEGDALGADLLPEALRGDDAPPHPARVGKDVQKTFADAYEERRGGGEGEEDLHVVDALRVALRGLDAPKGEQLRSEWRRVGEGASTKPGWFSERVRELLPSWRPATEVSDRAPDTAEAPASAGKPTTGPPEPAILGDAMNAPRARLKGMIGRLARDLSDEAAAPGAMPLIGRQNEIREVLAALLRRTKNAPVLVGRAGTGKTAIVREVARRLAADESIPEELRGLRVLEASRATLVGGASRMGETEERVTALVDFLRANRGHVLFIDEMHMLIGAGGMPGSGDVANMLKPVLADGAVRVMGATTTDEYERFVAADEALSRRFVPVRVDEPDRESTLRILEGLVADYEDFHSLRLEEGVLGLCVTWSDRILPNRAFPDKAIELLDTAMAHARLDGKEILDASSLREAALRSSGLPAHVLGDADAGLPERLDERLGERVFGMDAVVEEMIPVLRLTRRQLDQRPDRPDGVFYLAGDSHCGRGALARALAEGMHGGANRCHELDLGNYRQEWSLSRLIGSEAGYVGSENRGLLAVFLQEHPHSVLLLRDMHKAHPQVLSTLSAAIRSGTLVDARRRRIPLAHATVIITGPAPREIRKRRSGGMGFAVAPSAPAASGPDGAFDPSLLAEMLTAPLAGAVDVAWSCPRPSSDTLARIATFRLERLEGQMSGAGLEGLEICAPALGSLVARVSESDDPVELLQRTIDREVTRPIMSMLDAGTGARRLRLQTAGERADASAPLELAAIAERAD